MPPLKNSKMEKFCRQVAQGDDLVTAYITSGYKLNTGTKSASSRLYKRHEVKARIEELCTKIEHRMIEKCLLNKEWVLDGLRKIAEKCSEDPLNPSGANRAYELIGKELGMFRDTVAVTGADGGPVAFVIEGVSEAVWLPKPKS